MDEILLKDLTKYSRRGILTVRIIRIWDHWKPDHSDLFGTNFVMIDSQGGIMEGTIPKDKVQIFKNRISEGTIYKLSAYQVTYARERYKTVDHPWRVIFALRTTVEPIVPQPPNFPKYGYTAYPISQYQSRIKQIILLSDVVGLVTSITGIFMPSAGSADHRRQIHITDGQTPAVVTLWGKLAEDLDADRLQRWSAQEPIIILFVGLSVDEFNGNLAFKSSLATRWYINPTIPESEVILERFTARSHQIEIRTGSQNRNQATATTITELSVVDPGGIMGQYYKLEVKITEVVTKDDNWWYMACKQCWRGLKNDRSNCTQLKPAPRYKICLYGIDAKASEEENPTFAEFIFFGQQGSIITGKEADYLLEETRTRNEDTPRELLDLVNKKFIVTVILDDNTMNSDHYHFQVKFTEHMADAELLAPLPLHNAEHIDPAAKSSSSALPNETTQHSFPTTRPPTEPTPGEHQKLLSKEHEAFGTPPSSQLADRRNDKALSEEHEVSSTDENPEGKKRFHNDKSPSGKKTKKSGAMKQLFPAKGTGATHNNQDTSKGEASK